MLMIVNVLSINVKCVSSDRYLRYTDITSEDKELPHCRPNEAIYVLILDNLSASLSSVHEFRLGR